MGGCCAREQTHTNEIINTIQYTAEEILNTGVDSLSKPELRFEDMKLVKPPEEIQLDLIINNIQNSFNDRTKKITQIELYNLTLYFKDNYTESEYLLYDTRRYSEQKEDFIKKMKHINYNYNQIKTISDEKLENFKLFLDNKKIIFIINEKFLKKDNKSKGTPFEIISLLFNINPNIYFYILNSTLNEAEMASIFIRLLSFLSDKSYEKLPYILLNYRHVTTFYIDGYIFIHFLEKQIFSFDSLIDELRLEAKELSFENKFLKEMNITSMIIIDNNPEGQFKSKEIRYKKNIYKYININKASLSKYKNDISEMCEWLRNEVSKGHSIYINVENFQEQKNEWIFVVITILKYIIRVDYIEIGIYLKEKINYIPNISEIIDNCLKSNEFEEIFDN